MDLTTLAQRDELASEHQLGILEMPRTPRTFKEWALLFVGILAGCFLCWIAVVYFSGASFIESFPRPLTIETAILGILIFGLLLIPAIVHTFSYSSVYISTNGLVYLNRSRSGGASWEEIERVDLQRADYTERFPTLNVYLNDGTRISFLPIYVSHGSASLSTLNTFIQERVPPANLPASDR